MKRLMFLLILGSWLSVNSQSTNYHILESKIKGQCFEYVDLYNKKNVPSPNRRIWLVTIVKLNNSYSKCFFSITNIYQFNTLNRACPSYYFSIGDDLFVIQYRNIKDYLVHRLGFNKINGNLKQIIKDKVPDFDTPMMIDRRFRVVKIKSNKCVVKDHDMPYHGMPEGYFLDCK